MEEVLKRDDNGDFVIKEDLQDDILIEKSYLVKNIKACVRIYDARCSNCNIVTLCTMMPVEEEHTFPFPLCEHCLSKYFKAAEDCQKQ